VTPLADETRDRLPALDGLRGIAILLVMAFHLYGLVYVLDGRWDRGTVDLWVGRGFGVGWVGVDLFFVLSGFLITGILLDAKGSATYFRSFYARRVLRIFPLYYAFIIFMLVVAPRFDLGDSASLRDNQFWYWSYLTNIGFSFDGLASAAPFGNAHVHLWSLAVEEQFYLIWPLAVLALDRRKLAALCVVLIPLALGVRMFLISDLAPDAVRANAPYGLMPARFDTLALGALLAVGARTDVGLERWRRYVPLVLGVALAILAALFVTQEGISFIDPDVQSIGYTAIAASFACLLLLVVTAPANGALQRALSAGWLRSFGKYSYALYVVHPIVAQTIARRIAEHYDVPLVFGSQIPLAIAIGLGAGAASFGVAWLSWHLLERHFLALKRFFPYAGEPPRDGREASPAAEPQLAARTS
jgi:peptidoglycan/LPS O-acetylase OafA/YrhL